MVARSTISYCLNAAGETPSPREIDIPTSVWLESDTRTLTACTRTCTDLRDLRPRLHNT